VGARRRSAEICPALNRVRYVIRPIELVFLPEGSAKTETETGSEKDDRQDENGGQEKPYDGEEFKVVLLQLRFSRGVAKYCTATPFLFVQSAARHPAAYADRRAERDLDLPHCDTIDF
jgi:hypothetical protein